MVLVDGPVADEDTVPPREGARYTLIGESFESPLFPVQVQTEIDIKNTGRNSPTLHCPEDPSLIDSATL